MIQFLQTRNCSDEVLANVKEAKICSKSIHLMSISDFEKIGIALGDARLLCQKFSNEERRRQLADIVSAVRASSSSVVGKFKKEKSVVAVDVSWHNWCSSRKRFVVVQRRHGGGTRTHKFNKCTTLDNIFRYFKDVYFPNGKSLGKKTCYISNVESTFLSCAKETVEMNVTIAEYIKRHSLKNAKFVIHTKPYSFHRTRLFESDESSDSSQEFHLESTLKAKGKRRKGNAVPSPSLSAISQSVISPEDILDDPPASSFPTSDSNLIFTTQYLVQDPIGASPSEDTNQTQSVKVNSCAIYSGSKIFDNLSVDITKRSQNSKKNLSANTPGSNGVYSPNNGRKSKIEVEREIRAVQDEEFRKSLEADIENEEQKKREGYLKNLMAYRQSMLLPEPFMTEDTVLVCVWHMTLGKKQRFFYSQEKCTQIYHWIGSLSPEPEFFELRFTDRVVDPNDSLTTVERTVLSMHEVSESNLTINIIDNRILNVSKDGDSIEQNEKTGIPLFSKTSGITLICPICSMKLPATVIEEHADACAKNTFLDFHEEICSDSDESLVEIAPNKQTCTYNNSKTLIEKLKSEINSNVVIEEKAFKLRIRRGYAFKDFCEKLDKKRYQEQLGQNIYVEFYGEVGVDQGGPKREFFTETLEEMQQMLLVQDNGYMEPAGNLYHDISKGTWKYAGILIASSVCMNGPAPNMFAPWVYKYITDGSAGVLENIPEKLPGKTAAIHFYNELQSVRDVQQLRKLLSSSEGLQILSDIGHRSLPSKAEMSSKEIVLRSIYLKEKLVPVTPCLEQLVEGLKTYGLLSIIRKEKELFQSIFCKNDLFEWNFDEFDDLFEIEYSNDGSSKKRLEIDTVKAFTDAMEAIFYEDQEVKFRNVMKFITGTSTMPPLGMPRKIKITFKHDCSLGCACKITVSTCTLQVNLPCHYRSLAKMLETIVSSVKLSRGFHAI